MKALVQHDGIVRTKKVYSAESVSQTCLSVRPPMIPLPTSPSNENLTPAFFSFSVVRTVLSLLKKNSTPSFLRMNLVVGPSGIPCGHPFSPVFLRIPQVESPSLFCGGCQPLPKVGKYTCTSGRSVGSWLFFTFGLGLGEEEILLLLGGNNLFFAASILDFFTV